MTSIVTGPLPAPCEHKAETGCMLTALSCCCSCADKRPHAAAYPMYIDGQGMRMCGKRWQRYCRRCRDHWESQRLGMSPLSNTSNITIPRYSEMPDMNSYNNLVAQVGEVQSRPSENRPHPPVNSFQHPRNTRERQRANRARLRDLTPTRLARRLHPLGTMEDVQREDYESPLAGMFGRAYSRFRDAEDARQAAREAGILSENGSDNPYHITYSDPRFNPFHRPALPAHEAIHSAIPIRSRASFHSQFYGNPLNLASRSIRPFGLHETTETVMHNSTNPFSRFDDDDVDDERNPIDRQRRATSKTSEDLMVNFACKICLEQKIDIICEPCMHAVMCHWCSQIYREGARRADGRFDSSLWTCPICRVQISQCRKFYVE